MSALYFCRIHVNHKSTVIWCHNIFFAVRRDGTCWCSRGRAAAWREVTSRRLGHVINPLWRRSGSDRPHNGWSRMARLGRTSKTCSRVIYHDTRQDREGCLPCDDIFCRLIKKNHFFFVGNKKCTIFASRDKPTSIALLKSRFI